MAIPDRAAMVGGDREIVVAAARCWREARNMGHSVQPRLSKALSIHDCAMLAPVFDSLLCFYEAALGRPIVAGRSTATSRDERLLLALIDGSKPQSCLDCTESAASALDCAMCSTRIMMGLATGRPAARTLQ
ncbi:hypothetical protein [Sphingomonas koreensis]